MLRIYTGNIEQAMLYGPATWCSSTITPPLAGRRYNTLLAQSPSTIRNMRFEWRVADSATGSTEPTGRFFDLRELIIRQIDLS